MKTYKISVTAADGSSFETIAVGTNAIAAFTEAHSNQPELGLDKWTGLVVKAMPISLPAKTGEPVTRSGPHRIA